MDSAKSDCTIAFFRGKSLGGKCDLAPSPRALWLGPWLGRNREAFRWEWLLVLLTLFLAGCLSRSNNEVDERPRIVATTGMIADIVRQLTGESFEVIQLMGDGIDPHLYKPTRDDIVRLNRADLIFYNGLLLEGKMQSVLNRLGDSANVFAVTDQLAADAILDGEEHHPDPHVWMDVTKWLEATRTISDCLCLNFPEYAEEIQRRENSLVKELTELHQYGMQVIASIPPEHRILITSHDAFQYFGNAYGLEIEAIQGISTESEAGLQRINEIVDMLVLKKIPAVFIESSVPRDTIDAVIQGASARGHRVAIGGELYSDALGATGTYEGTYVGMLDHNFTLVARALGGQAPEAGWQNKLTGKKVGRD